MSTRRHPWPTRHTVMCLFYTVSAVAFYFFFTVHLEARNMGDAYRDLAIEGALAFLAIYEAWRDHHNLMAHIAERHHRKRAAK